jgi:ribonuclease HI
MKFVRVYFDGAGTNGTICEFMVIAQMFDKYDTEHKQELYKEIYRDHQVWNLKHTNNEMEYIACHKALAYISGISHIAHLDIELITDSQLVFYQILNKWKVKSNTLKEYYQKAKSLYNLLIGQIDIDFKWVNRKYNIAGIELEKIQRARK